MKEELSRIVASWLRDNEKLFKAKLKRLKVGKSGELERSIRSDVQQKGDVIEGAHHFKLHGRFRDMGVGRGSTIAGRRQSKIAGSRGGSISSRSSGGSRKPAKWYSTVFYGRLNTLKSWVSLNVCENANKAIISAFKKYGSTK
ncbi:hypothetical protein V6R21_19865 [Limibacter armeniacum]|uniref:hypothetical protein n=1 Tax=Limibacter armeniacum TaxID=466084 RepID=UPI002FE6286B